MKNEIVRKLNELMQRLPIDGDQSVVYLLVQVRKLSELVDTTESDGTPPGESRYPTLAFYCDWVLHSSLDRRHAQQFIQKVMSVLTLSSSTAAQHRELDSLLTLQTFREELQRFLVDNGISDALCTEEANWAQFVDAYARVVQDTKLKVKVKLPPSGPHHLAVESLTVEAIPGEGYTAKHPFPMRWVITYTNGRDGRLLLSKNGLAGAVLELSPLN